MQSSRKLVALLAVVLAILALGPAPAARAASAPPSVYPPQAHPYGHSYREWAVRDFQWWVAIPKAQDPARDRTGARCAEGQSGPVWHLTSNFGGTDVRTCTVPAGKALLINPAAAWDFENPSAHSVTSEALCRCAKKTMDTATEADVTVDGEHLTSLLTRYRFETPLFRVSYPADNELGVHGPGITTAEVDGIYVMVAPLAAGRHTVDLRFSFGHPVLMAGEVTYHLTVRR